MYTFVLDSEHYISNRESENTLSGIATSQRLNVDSPSSSDISQPYSKDEIFNPSNVLAFIILFIKLTYMCFI